VERALASPFASRHPASSRPRTAIRLSFPLAHGRLTEPPQTGVPAFHPSQPDAHRATLAGWLHIRRSEGWAEVSGSRVQLYARSQIAQGLTLWLTLTRMTDTADDEYPFWSPRIQRRADLNGARTSCNPHGGKIAATRSRTASASRGSGSTPRHRRRARGRCSSLPPRAMLFEQDSSIATGLGA
jgi:hypothetical protein